MNELKVGDVITVTPEAAAALGFPEGCVHAVITGHAKSSDLDDAGAEE